MYVSQISLTSVSLQNQSPLPGFSLCINTHTHTHTHSTFVLDGLIQHQSGQALLFLLKPNSFLHLSITDVAGASVAPTGLEAWHCSKHGDAVLGVAAMMLFSGLSSP